MRILPLGDRSILVEDPPGDPAAWGEALRSLAVPGVVDVVPAAATVLVTCDRPEHLTDVVSRFDEVVSDTDSADEGSPVVVPTVYDGADLVEVARSIGGSVDDVVRLHSGASYDVAFCGFAPGFGYLRGLPSELHLPRRPTPRTRVPAGSVAIAAEYSAVYPSPSPGGWHLLGTTPLVLFDVHRDPPSLFRPGRRVRFEPV
ncbi:MAG: allophanate hydrolase subunit 1 [Ilumatobacteraceae bacterium]